MSAKLYDWDELFLLDRFVLVRGVDFSCSFGGIGQQVRQAASKRGVAVTVVETDSGIKVIVRRKQDAAAQAAE